ncbi:MAG: hypothetical protein LQ340_004106 [Diploschistes diacapsis]|nr:MAG: hypothetical protein LQ340_004106 [Diploschistes diacapsis]
MRVAFGYSSATACIVLRHAEAAGDSDLFALGIDSLKIVELANLLRHYFRRHLDAVSWISTALMYNNPTSDRLAGAIFSRLDQGWGNVPNPGSSIEWEAEMKGLSQKYAISEETLIKTFTEDVNYGKTVLVTGSTGSLGNYILRKLALDTRVSKIYCLDRAPNAYDRLIKF